VVIYTIAWDLPSDPGMIHAYANKARADWIPTTANFKGVKEVSTYRNPMESTPQVLVLITFEDMSAWQEFVESRDNRRMMREARALGCTNVQAQVWAPSRMQPQPFHPGDEPRHVEDVQPE
jgi:heme-degrading monooxygenase HmoA